ncbi:hypothetical protein [Streptomyces sp. NPDC046870]|uniref:hypothetical protein n=1 Tax=Streptomyces sp. NPDC046870 TaxID=3155135 RepID=UPI0034557033
MPATGTVIGGAHLANCHQDPEGSPVCTPWTQAGTWHLILTHVQELRLPVPVVRPLAPWKPAPDLLTQVFRQLPGFRP